MVCEAHEITARALHHTTFVHDVGGENERLPTHPEAGREGCPVDFAKRS
jgi:hypothetical protein